MAQNSSFFMLGVVPMVQSSPIWQLHQLLDWKAIDNQLVGLYRREQTSGGGSEPYSPLSMFKLMLLGQWHNLSDEKLEHALTVRIDFMAFTGFEPDDRGYAVAETEDGYIEHIHMTPANESEVTKLTSVAGVLPQKPKAVLADKGFASKANRQWLQEQSIEDCIQHKASRGKPLHPLYKEINKCIGKLRYKVEQGFGTMKRQFGLSRARYFTTAKVQAQMCWAALGMNLLKAHNKLKQMQMRQGVGAP